MPICLLWKSKMSYRADEMSVIIHRQDTASKWGTCFKVLSRKVFCGLLLFPLRKLVIRLWSFVYKKHKTQSVFTEMGQRDSKSKGPIFLCMFTSFQRVCIYCFLVCITRLSLFIAEKLLKTRKLFLVVVYYFSLDSKFCYWSVFWQKDQLFIRNINQFLNLFS